MKSENGGIHFKFKRRASSSPARREARNGPGKIGSRHTQGLSSSPGIVCLYREMRPGEMAARNGDKRANRQSEFFVFSGAAQASSKLAALLK